MDLIEAAEFEGGFAAEMEPMDTQPQTLADEVVQEIPLDGPSAIDVEDAYAKAMSTIVPAPAEVDWRLEYLTAERERQATEAERNPQPLAGSLRSLGIRYDRLTKLVGLWQLLQRVAVGQSQLPVVKIALPVDDELFVDCEFDLSRAGLDQATVAEQCVARVVQDVDAVLRDIQSVIAAIACDVPGALNDLASNG